VPPLSSNTLWTGFPTGFHRSPSRLVKWYVRSMRSLPIREAVEAAGGEYHHRAL
jgi:hypothetical protein